MGVFSYFPTSRTSIGLCNSTDDIYILMPTQWNPSLDVYSQNEESMLDWEGNMTRREERVRILMLEVSEDPHVASICSISTCKDQRIDSIIAAGDANQPVDHSCANDVILSLLSPFYGPHGLYDAVMNRRVEDQFKMDIGATTICNSDYIYGNGFGDSDSEGSMDEIDFESMMGWDDSDVLDGNDSHHEYDLDDIMASAAHVRSRKDIDANHLSKVWHIDVNTAQRTLDNTSQNSIQKDNPALTQNYTTNDRMLCYARIKDLFFMDTFFATKDGGKSSRGHTCCQLFVTDRGYVHVVPMRKKGDVLPAIKEFTKAVGVPDAIVCDSAKNKCLKLFANFCLKSAQHYVPLKKEHRGPTRQNSTLASLKSPSAKT